MRPLMVLGQRGDSKAFSPIAESKLTIYGQLKSVAESFAAKHGIPFVAVNESDSILGTLFRDDEKREQKLVLFGSAVTEHDIGNCFLVKGKEAVASGNIVIADGTTHIALQWVHLQRINTLKSILFSGLGPTKSSTFSAPSILPLPDYLCGFIYRGATFGMGIFICRFLCNFYFSNKP